MEGWGSTFFVIGYEKSPLEMMGSGCLMINCNKVVF